VRVKALQRPLPDVALMVVTRADVIALRSKNKSIIAGTFVGVALFLFVQYWTYDNR
jgi:hypothetical protein